VQEHGTADSGGDLLGGPREFDPYRLRDVLLKPQIGDCGGCEVGSDRNTEVIGDLAECGLGVVELRLDCTVQGFH
jgi:hypothetical protein